MPQRRPFLSGLQWATVLTLLLGMVIGSLIIDPSDFLFFLRASQSQPLTVGEQIFYWYFLSSIGYFILFLAAFFMYRGGVGSPQIFVTFLIFLVFTSLIVITLMLSKEATPPYQILIAGVLSMIALMSIMRFINPTPARRRR